MIGVHRTKQGQIIPIIGMTDSHLLNTIRYFLVQPYDKWLAIKSIPEDLKFHLGGIAEKVTNKVKEPDVKQLITENIMYIAEALRRDNTRGEMLNILGHFNIDYANPTAKDFSVLTKFNNPLLLVSYENIPREDYNPTEENISEVSFDEDLPY